MSWRRVAKSAQAFIAHGLLFGFTLLVLLKLNHVVTYSWWTIFSPLWLFHTTVARGRFSLPAPSVPHDRHVCGHLAMLLLQHRYWFPLKYSFAYIWRASMVHIQYPYNLMMN
ncbi:hypothetical protein C5167_033078 [Papaver somniferum]|uniref:TLC domain-containing protein n=1 Tax=Papaver somniferum TaxID=3469 RepID=A0A4Y7KDB9_PAPSO|nr:hypothetical protein C5167_033078 [Papaver somniferum]